MLTKRTKTNGIIVHCSATKYGYNITVEDIRRWHVDGNKWKDIGYHFVIEQDGTIRSGRPIETIGSHVKGFNSYTVGICMVGGLDSNSNPSCRAFNISQFESLERLVAGLLIIYPGSYVTGHNELDNNKECPCFDVQEWYNNIFIGG